MARPTVGVGARTWARAADGLGRPRRPRPKVNGPKAHSPSSRLYIFSSFVSIINAQANFLEYDINFLEYFGSM